MTIQTSRRHRNFCIDTSIHCPALRRFIMKYLPSLTIAFLLLDVTYADYASDAESAIKLLQDKWYNTETGLW